MGLSERRTTKPNVPRTPRKSRKKNTNSYEQRRTETVQCHITGRPVSASSRPSMVPPAHGVLRCISLFQKMRGKQNADSLVKEVTVPEAGSPPSKRTNSVKENQNTKTARVTIKQKSNELVSPELQRRKLK